MKFSRLFSLVFLLVSVALWVFYLQPLRTKIDELNGTLVTKKDELSRLDQRIAEFQRIAEMIPQDKSEQSRLLKQISPRLDQDKLIRVFETIGRRYGINYRILNFSLEKEELLPSVKKVSISSSFEGEFQDLFLFLRALEAENRIIRVKSLELKSGDAEKSVFHLRMEAYYLS